MLRGNYESGISNEKADSGSRRHFAADEAPSEFAMQYWSLLIIAIVLLHAAPCHGFHGAFRPTVRLAPAITMDISGGPRHRHKVSERRLAQASESGRNKLSKQRPRQSRIFGPSDRIIDSDQLLLHGGDLIRQQVERVTAARSKREASDRRASERGAPEPLDAAMTPLVPAQLPPPPLPSAPVATPAVVAQPLGPKTAAAHPFRRPPRPPSAAARAKSAVPAAGRTSAPKAAVQTSAPEADFSEALRSQLAAEKKREMEIHMKLAAMREARARKAVPTSRGGGSAADLADFGI